MLRSQITNLNQSRNRQSIKPYQSKTFQSNTLSDIMSIATRRLNYAIQSVPHQIKHNKTAFKDYFLYADSFDEDVEQESLSNRPKNSVVKNNNLGKSYDNAQDKIKICTVLKDCIYNVLKQSFTNIKNTQKQQKQKHYKQQTKQKNQLSLIKKVPSLSLKQQQQIKKQPSLSIKQQQASTIKKTPTYKIQIQQKPSQHLQQTSKLQNTLRKAGRISKQQLSPLISPKQKTKSKHKYKFIQNQQTYQQNYIPIVNKLLYVDGISLLQSYGDFNIRQKNQGIQRKYSIITKQK